MKIAVITGAGSGVGRAVARVFAEAGFALVLAGRRVDPLDHTAALVSASGARAITVPTDVTDEHQVTALFDRVALEFGRLDLLFNNAGLAAPPRDIEDVTLAEWRRVFDVNVTGMFLCTRAAVRMMKAQDPRGGRIINNGSISAHVPRPLSAAYVASKHAVTGLTRATSLDERRYDIACGQIDIGNADTAMLAGGGAGALQPDGSLRAEPSIDVAHVARAVLYMANLPLDANVPAMTVMANRMPYAGRG